VSTLYLVRHAHAEWTPDENRALSGRGRADAERVVDVLGGVPITAIYASPARRARETTAPLAARLGLSIHILPDLRERALGHGAVDDFFGAVKMAWSDPSFAHPGGEFNTAAQRRGVAVVHRLQERHPDEHVVLATHGNLLALVPATVAKTDPSFLGFAPVPFVPSVPSGPLTESQDPKGFGKPLGSESAWDTPETRAASSIPISMPPRLSKRPGSFIIQAGR
jgi:2,3-bisphosphoglycerate-dependent phosphoglycerate mutase